MVSIPNGLPRPFSHPGHLVGHVPRCPVSIPNGLPRPFSPYGYRLQEFSFDEFQSRTGSPGHLAVQLCFYACWLDMFQSRTGSPGHLAVIQMVGSLSRISVSIPNGLPRPFSPMEFLQDRWNKKVSIPNGLPGHLAIRIDMASPVSSQQFQSRTGSPGHLAEAIGFGFKHLHKVSIPNGLPRPFSQNSQIGKALTVCCFNPERAPQAI